MLNHHQDNGRDTAPVSVRYHRMALGAHGCWMGARLQILVAGQRELQQANIDPFAELIAHLAQGADIVEAE